MTRRGLDLAVRAEPPAIVRLGMRNQEGTGVPGCDGVIESRRGTRVVPDGRSVWELGVGDDPRGKARRLDLGVALSFEESMRLVRTAW